MNNPFAQSMLHVLSICSITLAISSPEAWAAPDLTKLEFDRVQGSTLYLKTPDGTSKSFKTDLQEITYVGVLRTKTPSTPYFLVSARTLSLDKHLAADRSLFLLRPQDDNKVTQNQFIYPGRIVDPKSQGAILDSSGYYGQCVPEWRTAQKGDQYVVYHQERVDRRKGLQPSVLMVEVTPEGIVEKLIERKADMPKEKDSKALKDKKLCIKIEGRNRVMAKRPYDLSPKLPTTTAEDEDEEDAPTKENQTDKDLPSATE